MEEREGILRLMVRLVNAVSGVLVAGGWVYQFLGWGREVLGGKRGKWGGRGRGENGALLHGRKSGGGGMEVGGDDDDD